MTDSAERFTGIVKWFNSKTGYGFITVLGDETRDIFVHFSNVKVEGLEYTYLVQGEYIEFDLVETGADNEKHTHHAVNITGIQGGPILCQTRFVNRQQQQQSDETDTEPIKRTPSSVRAPARKPRSAPVVDNFVKVERKRRGPPAKKSTV
jgi:cold shock CspA family protein